MGEEKHRKYRYIEIGEGGEIIVPENRRTLKNLIPLVNRVGKQLKMSPITSQYLYGSFNSGSREGYDFFEQLYLVEKGIRRKCSATRESGIRRIPQYREDQWVNKAKEAVSNY